MCARRRNNLARFHLASGEVTKGSGPHREGLEPHDVGGAAAFGLPANEGNVISVMNPTHGVEGVQLQAGLLAMEEGAAGEAAAARPKTSWPVRAFTRSAAPAMGAASSVLPETNARNAMCANGENTL